MKWEPIQKVKLGDLHLGMSIPNPTPPDFKLGLALEHKYGGSMIPNLKD